MEEDEIYVRSPGCSCRIFQERSMHMSEHNKLRSYHELRFRDDFMFGKVMEDKELCREVLECLLQRPVGELRKH